MKKILRAALALLTVLVLIVAGYAAYLLGSYERIADNVALQVKNPRAGAVMPGEEYTLGSWNIGFAAYTADFSFFMDGGTESRAKSALSVQENMRAIMAQIAALDADFLLVQEVDEQATRSHHVNQRAMLEDSLYQYSSAFAVNYDSAYLAYPFREPHGKSLAGMLTCSRAGITSALRRSLPIEESLMKFLDLDRCYSVSRIPAANGRELVLYNVHLSAYTSDGKIAEEQLVMLLSDMQAEYEKGNYALCGGDFNKDLPGNSSQLFGNADAAYTWAQPIPPEMFAGTNLTLIAPVEAENPVPSCRNADAPYHEGQFVVTVDGFIASDNIEILGASVIDTGFAFSDHNPVTLRFTLHP